MLLQSVFAGKPFSEIACDDAVGVTWSPAESRKIGFTQRYANSLAKNAPRLSMLAALPANQRIGMSAPLPLYSTRELFNNTWVFCPGITLK